jgi:hypothetical protein
MEICEMGIELSPVDLLRDPIHPHRRILAQTMESALQSRLIDQMGP